MTLGAVVHLAICKHSKEGSIQHTWACSPNTVHFRWHHLANFSGKWLLPGRWQKLQEAVKQTDVGAARSHRHKTPLIICESYDVLTPHELKTIPPSFFFTVLLQHFLFSLLRQKRSGECLGVCCSRRRHGAGMTFLGEFCGQHIVTPCWRFKGRWLSPIAADSNRSFSMTSLVGNLATRVMAGVSCVHCLKAVSISKPYWSQGESWHWLNRLCMRSCVTAALTCVQIPVLPDE